MSVIAAGEGLEQTVGFELLGPGLAVAVRKALGQALRGGATFALGKEPLGIFRGALREAIATIEQDRKGRWDLFGRFLRDGPYEQPGVIPSDLRSKRLSDEQSGTVITFIYSSMVNSFKGAITELLAAGACSQLMTRPQVAGHLPRGVRLYVGDAVMVPRKSGDGVLKGADLHWLVEQKAEQRVSVAGVVEVKSGPKSERAMAEQIEKHIRRAACGLVVEGRRYPDTKVQCGCGLAKRVLRVTVQPGDWPLPRTLRFKKAGKVRRLELEPPVPPEPTDRPIPAGDNRWHIQLRWSKEAIAAAAYEMTFWYMEKVGERIYRDGVPKEWSEMTPAEAGRNAVKMMFYYAILRMPARSRIEQRAIALYNTYGFGYAIGMNFRNREGRREMLWPQDLDEIAVHGCNVDGCRIVGAQVEQGHG